MNTQDSYIVLKVASFGHIHEFLLVIAETGIYVQRLISKLILYMVNGKKGGDCHQ